MRPGKKQGRQFLGFLKNRGLLIQDNSARVSDDHKPADGHALLKREPDHDRLQLCTRVTRASEPLGK